MKVNKQQTVLKLALDHEDCVYRAQRWIKGTVTLQHPSSSSLLKPSIRLVGKEQTWSTTSLLHSCRGTKDEFILLFEEEQELHEPEPDDSFTYPFSIFLPGSMAPSMYLEDCCSVSYELTASYGTQASVSRTVHIVGPTLSTKTHPYCVSDDLYVENTHVPKGGSVSIRSSKHGLHVIRVMEEIHWKTHCGRTHSYAHILSEQRHAASEETILSVPIPSTARDTYVGTHRIQVTHTLCLDDKHKISLVICDPPLNSHHHHHSPSKESLQELMTTVWPADVVPENTEVSEHSSCPPIDEEQVVEVAE